MVKTTFRETLIRELGELARSREIDDRFVVRIVYVEEKIDVLGEFSDYYVDELLMYKPFADEFEPGEIAAIRRFMEVVRAGFGSNVPWTKVRNSAEDLLRRLG